MPHCRADGPTPSSPSRLEVLAPLRATVVAVDVVPGQAVRAGQTVVVLESMKMEQPVAAGTAATVVAVHVEPGAAVLAGAPLVTLVAADDDSPAAEATPDEPATAPGSQRPELTEVLERHRLTLDEARPEEIARRHRTGQRSAREDIAELCDPGSFVEYGPLVVAAQRRRRSLDELIARTPADGLVGGVARVGGRQTVVASYDYTVLAGTQGIGGHAKKDRLFTLAADAHLPVVLFCEGGGGRPGDTDGWGLTGLDCMAFRLFAGLSGQVPLVGIANGRCFAGNAALLGCCDVVIATEGSSIGMGGPAMVEGGGLGVFPPEQIGPLEVQVASGVVDIAVADQSAAVAAARRCLAYLDPGGTDAAWEAPDQLALRELVPTARRRAFDMRAVIAGLADTGSVLELRGGFAPGMLSVLARVEGRRLGVLANNPLVDGGAIGAAAADKAAHFLQFCDAHRLPVLSLVDTPGFLVGPEAEATGLVRHAARMFVVAASLSVPVMTVVVRRAYGLGAQAMAGGSLRASRFAIGWPTSELGAMGLEGAVRLGYRRELEAITDPVARSARFEELLARSEEQGRGLSVATVFELDDVIDPAESRRWISMVLSSTPPDPDRRRRYVDPW